MAKLTLSNENKIWKKIQKKAAYIAKVENPSLRMEQYVINIKKENYNYIPHF